MTDTLAELEAIRARHVACGHIEQWPDFDSFEAHTDRGTLIRLFEKAQAELAEVREAIKRQAAAVRNLQTSEDSQINVLRKQSQQAHIAASTLDSERNMNAILTEENERLRAELAEVREAAEWAYDTLHEINVSNYDHDDVCRLNDASVEVILGLARALKGETR